MSRYAWALKRGGQPCPEAAAGLAEAIRGWAGGLGVSVCRDGHTVHVVGEGES